MEENYQQERSFFDFLFTKNAMWYWIIIIINFLTIYFVFTIPSQGDPLGFFRNFFGLLFVLFIPGFSLIRGLFLGSQLDDLQKYGLSLGTSVALVPLIALLLNFTPFGIVMESLVVSLFLFTLVVSTGAIFREYRLTIRPS